ncbi:MAG: hypothetical protein GY943_06735 [Chloroflexi bacterium]|nr:hypothetical protein [Chloroflexota bacterium]
MHPSDNRNRFVFVAIALLTILFLAAVAFNVSPYLRGPEDWRWAYAIPGRPFRHLLPVVVIGLYCVAALFVVSSRRVLPSLLFLAVAVPVIQLVLLWPESIDVVQPLFFRTISPGASGIFTVGSTIQDVQSYLGNYPALMPTFPVHPQRYPPGLALSFFGLRQLLEKWPVLSDAIGFALRPYQCQDLSLMGLPNATLATAVLQMGLPFIMGLIVFPLYGLSKRTIGEKGARFSVVLYPIIPSFVLWAGRWDQFYPLLMVLCWYLLCVGLQDKRPFFSFLAGVILSIATMLSFGVIAILAPMGLWVLFWWWRERGERPFTTLVSYGLLFFAGLLSLWLVYEVAFGIGFREIWQVSMGYHLGLARNYQTWLFYHLYDFGIFLSIPVVLLLIVAGWRSFTRFSMKAAALPLAFVLGLLLLDLSGTSQGEVARVWLFLTPFAVMTAAWGLSEFAQSRWQVALVVGLTAVNLLTFNFFLRVVTTGVPDPIARVHEFELAEFANPIDAQFSDEILLQGYDLETAGGTVDVTLYWQALQPMTHSYTVFMHVIDADGQLVAQHDGLPMQGNVPTTCWVSGEMIADKHTLDLPENVDGQLSFVTGLYRLETGERLSTAGAGQVLLTTITRDQNE